MNDIEEDNRIKFIFYFSIIILSLEVYFWEEIYNTIISIDYLSIIRGVGIYAVLKIIVMYGLIEIFSVFLLIMLLVDGFLKEN